MSYRTIVVHADRAANAEARIALAAAIALREEAHLVGAAMTGMPRSMLAGRNYEGSGVFLADYLRRAEERVQQALEQFKGIAERLGVPSFEARSSNDDEYAGLCMQARYADLLVLGQAAAADSNEDSLLPDLPDYVLLNCGRPVLLVPRTGRFPTIGKRVMVAWNGSVEAAKAVTAALPLLRGAEQVTLAVLGDSADTLGESPGADIALYLARHGVKVEVLRRAEPADPGKAILSLAADFNVDLLVMGAYGHSRFREMMLGGATRSILATATLPVLMAH
ncbi:Nucleotide-binding universal stress protein, UspA family [Duganella sp. CF458]|uniref:universal stress protein n=1 Tax=Duganella sp. CF458 TaxID=1884368 RepID=UPI0008EC28F1|nr:universal stress protein [Duganella sp. CF458]SFF96411.1 Nucleotide-binding universal stress protein, UspA family [Duganella sp. CF458]